MFPRMVHAVPGILARIVERKREALARDSARLNELEKKASDRRDFRDFKRALTANPPAIIAEIKKASPSKGVFAENFHPDQIAATYESGGAAALSVLTDAEFFQGSLGDLQTARAVTRLPALRKDFTISEFHVVEAAASGADAILLIAAILSADQMKKYRELATRMGMAALVEVHDGEELEQAIDSGAEIIGVNNRDLNTFEVTLETSLALAPKIPRGAIKVAESGVHSSDDVRRLAEAGFDAFLAGEHLMKSSDPAAAIRKLRS
ncbi:MAG TPA: indole-3-glycerol phosphate synthase TrpC [Bryobacteraceae bacterium]|nr:indole-3-glycerol phosphate synthase TrpC [Bryobacteraceae bacterium]